MEEYIKEAPQTGSVNKRLVRKLNLMYIHKYAYTYIATITLTEEYAHIKMYGYVIVYLFPNPWIINQIPVWQDLLVCHRSNLTYPSMNLGSL